MAENRDDTDLREIIPEIGDSVTIVNKGDWFHMIVNAHKVPELQLTAEDVEDIMEGRIVWN